MTGRGFARLVRATGDLEERTCAWLVRAADDLEKPVHG